MPPKSNFLDKALGRIGRLDTHGLQTVVERLARERTFLETLFNTIEDGVLVVDEKKRIIYLNSAVSNLLGIQSSAEGQPVMRYLPELDWEQLMNIDAEGGPRVIRQELEITLPRPRFLHLYAAPLDGEKSGSAGVALILRDATEARAQTFQAIEDERVQALTLLAASVAHEIGNPLNALHIHLQLMERELRKMRGQGENEEEGGESAEVHEGLNRLDEYLHVAKEEIRRLDNIITQFLDGLRARAPKMALASLNKIIGETMELLGREIENRGQRVIQKLAGDLPEIPCDATQIQQVLVNLIRNAMQAMNRGGEIRIETGAGSEAVWVSISDTGSGIPEEKLNRIFQPFFTTKKKGSGLGLMIVQRIIRDHGGKIDLESKPGRGTTFRVWLPMHERRPRLLHAGTPANEVKA